MTDRLTEPVSLASRTAPSRVIFGPHETNLGHRRALSDRHVAYYARRAAAGAGVIVTEVASVHESDWPYERAPLAADCAEGWRRIAEACHEHGTVVLAGLGHTGLQGSSAYSQAVLWGPSRFPDAASREVPMEMEEPEIDALVTGFAAAARRAAAAGLDGVEIDAGSGALLRQFQSGLTNTRDDEYGTDRLRLTRDVLTAVRREIGPDLVLSLRLSCDELAPWAGITPEIAATQAADLAGRLDLLVVVRGGPYSAGAYRPDAHTEPSFNLELARGIRAAVGEKRNEAGRPVLVALQGSVVDTGAAQDALDGGAADLVEMTRAQIADADLVAKLAQGRPERIRPCILCNQTCMVRDNRNPVVTCVGDPRSGHETEDAAVAGGDAARRDVLVVGAGPAGLEAARVLALRGHSVRVAEREPLPGGTVRAAAVGAGRQRMARLADWLEAECRRLGVRIDTGADIDTAELDAARAGGADVLLATGSVPAPRSWASAGTDTAEAGDATDTGEAGVVGRTEVRDALGVLAAGPEALPEGPIVVHDPVGGPIGVGVAEWLAAAGRQVSILVPDQIVGTLLSRTGDLADANTRLQRAGVARILRSTLRAIGAGAVLAEDVWTGERREIDCALLVDCGHRLADESLYRQRPGTPRAGDCVAPRTIHEAVLEGRRRALDIGAATAGFP